MTGRLLPQGRQRCAVFLRVDVQLAAESAPDFRRDNANLVRGYAQRCGEAVLEHVRNLCGRPHRQSTAAYRLHHYATRFHWIRNQALVDVTKTENVVGFGQGFVDVLAARFNPKRHVAAEVFPDKRRALLDSRFDVDYRVERFVIDLYRLGRVSRDVAVLGHYRRHRVTQHARLARRQRLARRFEHVRRRRGVERYWADVVLDVIPDEYVDDAVHFARG